MKRIVWFCLTGFVLIFVLCGLYGCSQNPKPDPVSEPADPEPVVDPEPSAEEPKPEEKVPVHRILYLSPDGSDEGDGSREKPFATIEAAKNVLKKEKPDSAEVILSEGTYFVSSPILFKSNDCPNVVYRSAEGEKAVLTGGISLKGNWDGISEMNGHPVWVKRFDEVPMNGEFNALFGESGFLPNARYPEEGGYLHALGGGRSATPDEPLYARNYSLFAEKSDIPDLSGEDLSHSYMRVYHYWTEETLPLESYDPLAGEFVFCDPVQITISENDCYCLENVRCGFDDPGEWFFDYNEATLYYYPKEGESQTETEIVYPVTDKLLTLQGAKNIRFEDLAFQDTGWKYEILCSQSAQNADACILLTSCSDVTFQNCDFSRIGQTCLAFGNYKGYVKDCTADGCSFHDIGMQAVVIGGDNVTYSTADGISVTDCYISRYGKARRQAAGILMTFGKNCILSHNEICDGGYTGISVGWTWGFGENVNENNRICDNLIYHIGHIPLSDMGGIYVLGVQQNSVISGNVIFDVCAGEGASTYGGWGIYLDEGAQEFEVFQNLVYGCGSQGFHQNYGRENKVYHNIFALNEDGQVRSSNSDEKYNQIYLTGNILVGKSQLMYQHPVAGRFADDGNLYYDYDLLTEVISGTDPDVSSRQNISVSAMKNRGYYRNAVFEDPCFVDAEGYNFSFTDTKAAERIGFTPYDFSSSGSLRFGSGLLVNTFSAPLSCYPENWVSDYKKSKAVFLLDRSEASVSAFRLACERLHSFDPYAGDGIDIDALCGGSLADEYFKAVSELEELLCSENSDENAVKTAAEKYRSAAAKIRASSVKLELDTGKDTSTVSFSYGEQKDLPVPVREGYRFIGWQKPDGRRIPAEHAVIGGCGEVVLTAVWEPVYPLDLDGETVLLKEGERIHLPVLKKNGMVFLGWNKKGDSSRLSGSFTMPAEAVSLNSVFAEEGILIFENWQTSGKNEIGFVAGEPVGVLPQLSKFHSIFLGWNTEANGNGTVYTEETIVPSGKTRLYPMWAESHMLFFNNEFDLETVGGFEAGHECSQTVLDYDLGTIRFTVLGENAFLNVSPVKLDLKPGHTYQLFYTFTVDGVEQEKARMTIMPYDLNNEWGSSVYIENLESGDYFTVDNTYHYISLRPGASHEATGATACYSDIFLIDVSDSNGNLLDITMPTTDGELELARLVGSGETVGKLPVMEKSGYTFKGWNTMRDGSGVSYTPETVMPRYNVHLWAMWE